MFGHLFCYAPYRLILLLTTAGLSSFLACGIYTPTGTSVITQCEIPSDQTATFLGNWATLPIPIAFHQGDFSSSELASGIAAATTWNTFFTASQSKNLFDFSSTQSPRTSAASNNWATLCSQSPAITGSSFINPIVIYKNFSWSEGASIIALTHHCTYTGPEFPIMVNALLEVNYTNFFNSGQELPDLQTILLHELGHVTGLNHSCEFGSTATGMPDCSNSSVSSTYLQAIMYPSFPPDANGNGVIRRSLGTNDEYRENCLY